MKATSKSKASDQPSPHKSCTSQNRNGTRHIYHHSMQHVNNLKGCTYLNRALLPKTLLDRPRKIPKYPPLPTAADKECTSFCRMLLDSTPALQKTPNFASDWIVAFLPSLPLQNVFILRLDKLDANLQKAGTPSAEKEIQHATRNLISLPEEIKSKCLFFCITCL